MLNIRTILQLLRVRQWLKNSLVLFPLVFSGHSREPQKVLATFLSMFAFCMVVSSVYIFNDLCDATRDQIHPVKKKRPLSSQKIQVRTALLIAGVLLIVGLSMALAVNFKVAVVILAYLLVHFIYNWRVRDWVFFDVLLIAIGFQLRIWAGCWAIGVMPSGWLQICVFFLSLLLGFTKRRSEIVVLGGNASGHRSSLVGYQSLPLDGIIIFLSVATMISYLLYTISPELIYRLGGHRMVFSSIFVDVGLGRYLYLVYVQKLGEDVSELILNDIFSMLNIVLWLLSIYFVLYGHI